MKPNPSTLHFDSGKLGAVANNIQKIGSNLRPQLAIYISENRMYVTQLQGN